MNFESRAIRDAVKLARVKSAILIPNRDRLK
jgi:hypothetical protein